MATIMCRKMQICYTLGTTATFETEVFLIGFDFFSNIYLCTKIIWVIKRRPGDINKQIALLARRLFGKPPGGMLEPWCDCEFPGCAVGQRGGGGTGGSAGSPSPEVSREAFTPPAICSRCSHDLVVH